MVHSVPSCLGHFQPTLCNQSKPTAQAISVSSKQQADVVALHTQASHTITLSTTLYSLFADTAMTSDGLFTDCQFCYAKVHQIFPTSMLVLTCLLVDRVALRDSLSLQTLKRGLKHMCMYMQHTVAMQPTALLS